MTGCTDGPSSVTAKVALPAPALPSGTLMSATATVGPSSSTMVDTAAARAGSIGVVPPASDSFSVNSSSTSSRPSLATETSTVFAVSPGLKVSAAATFV